MAGGFGSASLPLISAIALLVGTTCLVLGFAAPYWANDGTYYVGLWRYGKCSNPDYKDCFHYDQPSLRHIPDWLHTVRALECIAVILVAIPLIIIPVYMYIALGMYYKCMLGTLCVFVVISAITGVVGVGIYGYNLTNNNWKMAWSLIVVVVGCACNFIGFLVLLVACCAKRPPSVREMNYYPTTIYVDPHKNKLYTIRLDDEE